MKREAYFDNAKAMLIFLVVFGHVIQPFTEDMEGIYAVYQWIYTFHMPAFILTAGFFAKGEWNLPFVTNLMKKLLIPYLIFQIMYSGYYFFLGKNNWFHDLLLPHWGLWFLFSLFCWHMLLPIYKRIIPIYGVCLAFIIGVLIGFIPNIGSTFSLSRTFVFFPFFLMGYWMNQEHIVKLKKKSIQVAAIFIMLITAFIFYLGPTIGTGLLLGSQSYTDLGLNELGGFFRIVTYAISLIMAISFLSFVPRREMSWSYIGKRTLYVYLLHGFFIQYFREFEILQVNDFLDIIGLLVVSLAITLMLASRPIQWIASPFVELKVNLSSRWGPKT